MAGRAYIHFDDLTGLVELLEDGLSVLVVNFDQMGLSVKLNVSFG